MAGCAMRTDKALVLMLDASEMETLRQHAKRENLSVTDAMAGLVEFAIHQRACEICQEEKEAVACPDASMGMVDVDLTWPTSGPYAIFTHDDKQFVGSVLAMSLREALTVVLYKRGFEGKHNVVERKDERDGTGNVVVPIDGRSIGKFHRGSGPDTAGRHVSKKAASAGRLPRRHK